MKNLITLITLFSFLIVNGQNWNQLGLDIDGEVNGDYSGQTVSMNANGDRVAIGANSNDGVNGLYSGHVRIYEWDGAAWVQLGLDIDGEYANDQSGYSVSMNEYGDRVAIGAVNNDGNGNASGHVRIYEWSGTAWVQLGVDIDGEYANDQSGIAVSMNAAGDRVAIGAFKNDGNGAESGHVRIYEWSGTAWVQLGVDIDGEYAYDQSGIAVSMNAAGDRVAIGAFKNDGNGADAGHVRIYEWSGTAWVQLGLDIDGEYANDQSGYSVSMNENGDRVAISALWNYDNGSSAGHVRIYEWSGTSWVQLGLDIDGEAAYDDSGSSVSMNAAGDIVAIGARYNDGNGNASGHVRIYKLPPPCFNYLEADTTSISIPDSNFQNINSFVRLERTDSFVINNNCDSIIEYYYLYNYSPVYCTDTLTYNDTLITNVTDTIIDTLNVFDTTYVSISVTDTLYIDILITGVNNVSNTIKVYPNPANDIVVIDNGNYSAMSNYSINITNSLSQQVYSSLINSAQFQIPVSTLGSVGTYFIQILDGSNNVVETKQLVLH